MIRRKRAVFVLVALALLTSFVALSCASETRPWGIYRVRTCCNWDNDGNMVVDTRSGTNPGGNALVAVIDTGVYYTEEGGRIQYHADLNANILSYMCRGFYYQPLWNQTQVIADHADIPNWHGTHVIGTIAAVDNDIGMIGGAPWASVAVLKIVHQSELNYAVKEVAAAINWVMDHYPPHIISFSGGFSFNDSALRAACNNAYSRGTLLIASSGNDNKGFIEYPAAYSSVIAVGAVNETCKRWVFSPLEGSNYGPKLELVAPGANINSTIGYDGYALKTGTSMAVPHVTAVAAMIFSSKIDPSYDYNQNGLWDNYEVRAKLRHDIFDIPPTGRDDYTGYGLVNGWATSQRPLGDINVDLKVDAVDLAIVSKYFGTYWESPNPPVYAWAVPDINIDNKVDIQDVARVSANFGKSDP